MSRSDGSVCTDQAKKRQRAASPYFLSRRDHRATSSTKDWCLPLHLGHRRSMTTEKVTKDWCLPLHLGHTRCMTTEKNGSSRHGAQGTPCCCSQLNRLQWLHSTHMIPTSPSSYPSFFACSPPVMAAAAGAVLATGDGSLGSFSSPAATLFSVSPPGKVSGIATQ